MCFVIRSTKPWTSDNMARNVQICSTPHHQRFAQEVHNDSVALLVRIFQLKSGILSDTGYSRWLASGHE